MEDFNALSGSKKAGVFLTLIGQKNANALVKYLSTKEIKKLRRSLSSINAKDFYNETQVLEEAYKYGMAHKLIKGNMALLKTTSYNDFLCDKQNEIYRKGIKDASSVASVIEQWLKMEV